MPSKPQPGFRPGDVLAMATDKHQVLGGLKFPVPAMSERRMLVSDMGNPPG